MAIKAIGVAFPSVAGVFERKFVIDSLRSMVTKAYKLINIIKKEVRC